MNLFIELNGNNICLKLKEKNKVIGESSWKGEYSLSEQLLIEIDALLKKSGTKKEAVKKVVTKISKTSGVTSTRIVQTVAAAWNTSQKIS